MTRTWLQILPRPITQVLVALGQRYRPERHFMRGSGPKSEDERRPEEAGED